MRPMGWMTWGCLTGVGVANEVDDLGGVFYRSGCGQWGG